MRISGMTFTDGSSIDKETAFGDKTLDYLYALADRHYEAAEKIEIRAVSVHSSCMESFLFLFVYHRKRRR